MFKHALIATDGSELSTRALATGLSLAKALEAKATIVTVTEPRTESDSGSGRRCFAGIRLR